MTVDTSREAVKKRASVLYSEAGCASELGHGRFAAHYLEARDMLLALLSERDALRAAKEKAEAERGNLIEKGFTLISERDQARADLAVAKAKAVEVMGPFAGFGDFLASETEGFSDDDELRVLTESGYLLYNFSVGVFRAASALVEEWK